MVKPFRLLCPLALSALALAPGMEAARLNLRGHRKFFRQDPEEPAAAAEHAEAGKDGEEEPEEPEPNFTGARQPPAPPPPPAPPRLPAKFPVASDEDCKLLEKGMVVNPKPKCQHIVMASNKDGCNCFINLPGSINPMPDTLQNPWAVQVPPSDANAPDFAALPTVPPPANPLTPFNAPMMVPSCPFSKKCAEGDEECVGFNTWGFSSASMGRYSPASSFGNSINCFYIAEPYDRFAVPKKVQAVWDAAAAE